MTNVVISTRSRNLAIVYGNEVPGPSAGIARAEKRLQANRGRNALPQLYVGGHRVLSVAYAGGEFVNPDAVEIIRWLRSGSTATARI